MSDRRILCLIDAENLYYSPRKQWGPTAKVDFRKLFKLITKGDPNSTVIIYLVSDPLVDQTRFVDRLKGIGYIPKMKVLYSEDGKYQNSNWDDTIIEDGLTMLADIDELVMVSGDGDFAPLLLEYKKRGKATSVFCFESDFSPSLHTVADSVFFLDKRILFNFEQPVRYYPRPRVLPDCRFPMQ